MISGRAPRRGRADRLFFLFDRHGDLAGGGEGGDFRRRRLACALGDFAPRFLLFAALRLFLGALARILGGTAARFFFFDPGAGFFFGPAARLFGGPLLLLAAAVGLGERGAAARLLIGFLRILHRAHAPGALLGGQGARDDDWAACRLGGLRTRDRRRFARDRGRRFGLAGFRRARSDHALLADLDGDGLGAAMRETLAHLAGFHTLAQLQPAARAG